MVDQSISSEQRTNWVGLCRGDFWVCLPLLLRRLHSISATATAIAISAMGIAIPTAIGVGSSFCSSPLAEESGTAGVSEEGVSKNVGVSDESGTSEGSDVGGLHKSVFQYHTLILIFDTRVIPAHSSSGSTPSTKSCCNR